MAAGALAFVGPISVVFAAGEKPAGAIIEEVPAAKSAEPAKTEKTEAAPAKEAAPDKKTIVEESAAAGTPKAVVPKDAKKAAKPKAAPAQDSLKKLVEQFEKYSNTPVSFGKRLTNPKDADYDKALAKDLKTDLLRWKKMRLQAKELSRTKDSKYKAKRRDVLDFEKQVVEKYGSYGESVATEPGAEEKSPDLGGAKTEKGKEILDRLRARQEEEAKAAAAAPPPEEPRRRRSWWDKLTGRNKQRSAPAPSASESTGASTTGSAPRVGSSDLSINPVRVTFNGIEPGAEVKGRFTIKNKGGRPFEGAVVAIENWLAVEPSAVSIEAGGSLDIDVKATALEKGHARYEGSIEVRAENESSRRVPVVLRTR